MVRRAALTGAALGALAVAAASCSLILGIPSDRYLVDGGAAHDAAADRSVDAGCEVPDGFPGSSCVNCAPQDPTQVLNACTGGQCTPFDNYHRIPGFDGGVRPLPADSGSVITDGGVPNPSDGGTVLCSKLPSPVYLYGSTTLDQVMWKLAQAIPSTSATVIKGKNVSCNALDAVASNFPATKMTGLGQYWLPADQTGAGHYCTLDDGGVTPDVAVSDVYPESCYPNSMGLDNIGDFPAQVQTYMFIVPNKSDQYAISAEAAYEVYGLGKASGVAPWTQGTTALRPAGSGHELVLSACIGLPASRWMGDVVLAGDKMVPTVTGYPDPNAALGITSADIADNQRDKVRTLAFQARGQRCAFTPDSEPGAHDKRNVRDGHYFLWAPVHFYTRVDGNGVPIKPAVGQVIDYLTGAQPLPPSSNLDVITAFKQAGLIPRCAMKVTRQREGGPLLPYTARPSCGCAFEKADPATGTSNNCVPCKVPGDCPPATPACNFGYCEPQ